MGLFDKLFGNKNVTETKTNDTVNSIDFDKLVNNARNSENENDLNILYKSFFELKELVFIVSDNCAIENAKPFIGVIEEQPWLFIFTDSAKADQYAKTFGNFLSNNGNTFVLKMKMKNSLDMAKELNKRGVFGVRINEGENGWFSDIPGLFDIIDHLGINVDK